MKLAIVIGHNARSQGAVRADSGQSEYVWNGKIAALMVGMVKAGNYPGLEVAVFRRQTAAGYKAEIRAVYRSVDRWGADLAMELHFNGAATPAATGTEMLTSGSNLSMMAAQKVQAAVLEALGLRNRGILTRRGSGRGSASLMAGKAPAILTEPFFGSSPKGTKATDEAHERRALAKAYLDGAYAALVEFPGSNLRPKVRAEQPKTKPAPRGEAFVRPDAPTPPATPKPAPRPKREGWWSRWFR